MLHIRTQNTRFRSVLSTGPSLQGSALVPWRRGLGLPCWYIKCCCFGTRFRTTFYWRHCAFSEPQFSTHGPLLFLWGFGGLWGETTHHCRRFAKHKENHPGSIALNPNLQPHTMTPFTNGGGSPCRGLRGIKKSLHPLVFSCDFWFLKAPLCLNASTSPASRWIESFGFSGNILRDGVFQVFFSGFSLKKMSKVNLLFIYLLRTCSACLRGNQEEKKA